MPNLLHRLESKIGTATGADRDLDADLHEAIYGTRPDDVPAYTASVDSCLALFHDRLPEWHWHIGYGPRGIFPYAVLTHDPGSEDAQSEMIAPTVPLALLGALVKALRMEEET
jgi:hypothetical protein